MPDLLIYTPDKVYRPPVHDILTAIAEDYPQIGQVARWRRGLPHHLPVLGLGSLPPESHDVGIKTLSQNQIMAFPTAVTEVRAALDLMFYPPKLRPFDYVVWNTRYAGNLDKELGDIVVVDIETGGDIKTWLPEEMWLLSVALYDGEKIIVLSEEWLADPENRRSLIRFLRKKKRKLIAHNMKFDFRQLSAALGTMIYGHLDTQLLHHASHMGAKEHGLKALAAKYLGAPDWDSGAKKYVKGSYKDFPEDYYYPSDLWSKYTKKFGRIKVGFEAIPRDVLYEYNAWDVYWTWHLYEYLMEKADERIIRVALHEYRMSNFFQDVESWGITADPAHMDYLTEVFEGDKEEPLQWLADNISPDFNPNSPAQVKEVLESAGLTPQSTDEDTLNEIHDTTKIEPVRLFIEALIKIRKANKNLSTYVEGARKRMHGRQVYPQYNVAGTNTGRLSSKDPNIQNIPRDKRLRALYTVEDQEKYDFLEVDYSQAELRTMAVLSNDAYLISLFQPGMPDFFTSLLPVTFPHSDIDSWTAQEKKDNRAKLKSVVYGLSYGRKAGAIAVELGMKVSEAQEIINNYFAAAPDFYKWRLEIEAAAKDPEGIIETPFGRRYEAEIVTGRNLTSVVNSALSFIPQSTASDVCISAAMEIHKWIGDYGAKIITSVHDAINVQCPKEHTLEVARRMQYEMSEAARRIFGDAVPFDTEAECGPTWGATQVINTD